MGGTCFPRILGSWPDSGEAAPWKHGGQWASSLPAPTASLSASPSGEQPRRQYPSASTLAASSFVSSSRRDQSHGLRSRKWLPASLADSAAFRSSLVASISRPAVSPPAFSHREPLAVSSLTVGCLMINIVPFAVCCRFSTSAASHRSVSAQAALVIDFSNRHAQHRR